MAEKKEKIKLNEIVAMNTDLLNYLEADEIDDETFNDTKELILTELQNKGGTIVFARRQSEKKIETYKNLAKYYTELAKSEENKNARFDDYMLWAMEQMKVDKIDTNIGTIKITKSKSTNEEQLALGLDINGNPLPETCYEIIIREPERKRLSIKEIEAMGIELKKDENVKIKIK